MSKVWRASFQSIHTVTGVQFVNTFHGVSTEDTLSFNGDGSAAQVRDALVATLGTLYRPCLPATCTLQTLLVREVLTPGSTDVPEEASHSFNQVGTIATSSDQLPIPLAVLVTLYSNAAIRSGHGRMFLPNMGNAAYLDSSGNFVVSTSPFTNVYKAFFDELLTTDSIDTGSGQSATWHPVIYSRTRHANGVAPYTFDLASYTFRTKPHWLRSRSTAP